MIIYPTQLSGADLIAWLESPDGEWWSRSVNGKGCHQARLVSIKEDRYTPEPVPYDLMTERQLHGHPEWVGRAELFHTTRSDSDD
jgi:hypothetical protein